MAMAKDEERVQLRLERLRLLKSASPARRGFFELEKRLRRLLYLTKKPTTTLSELPQRPHILFVTVAFNQKDLVALQLEALRRFVQEPHGAIVVDNSPDVFQRAAIRKVCKDFGVGYIPAPKNPYSWLDPSLSHAFALDWAWEKLVRKIRPEIVVFLDHDLFPIDSVSIEELIASRDAVGQKKGEGSPWFLWPGFLLMRWGGFVKRRVSFMPRGVTDSGGQMWWSAYRKMDTKQIGFVEVEIRRFKSGESPSWHGEVHLFAKNWLHLVDGSGWGDGEAKGRKLPLPSFSLESLTKFVHSIPVRSETPD